MTYIRVPITTDPATLQQSVYDYIQARAAGWLPNDGNLDTWIIAAMTQEAAANRDLASDVPDAIYRRMGASLFGVPPFDAKSATAQTTWTLSDTNGHTIPAGTAVAVQDASGQAWAFQVVSDVVVAPGSNTTTPGEVLISALVVGAAASGLGGIGTVIQLIDVLDFVSSVVLTGPTTGGVDAESDDAYLGRLVRRLQRLSERPILPQDFSNMALDADPGVDRAVAIDGYDPVANTLNNPRMMTVAAVDINGAAATSGMKTSIQTLLEANREVNFIVNVMDPQYNLINVTADVVKLSSYDSATVQANVEAAINDYLSPAKWGRDPNFSTDESVQTWVDRTTLYYNDLLAALDVVAGVDRVSDLQIAIQGNALGRVDLALTSPATLTQPGASIVVNVT